MTYPLAMPCSLEERLRRFRRRARSLLLLHGVGWTVAAVVGLTVILGVADYFIRFEDRGLRLMAWAGLLGAVGATGFFRLYRPLAMPLTGEEIARRLQRKFNHLDDRLLSSIEFLNRGDDPLAGSPELRQAVIAETAAAVVPLDFSQALDARPATQAAVVSLLVLTVAIGLVLIDPTSARIAIARLLNPFDSVAWPVPRSSLPPRLVSLEVSLQPPDYTGWPKQPAEPLFQALAGTKISMSGKADKPLRAATLCLDDGRRFPAVVGPDEQSFTVPAAGAVPLLVERSGEYWLELLDTDGLLGRGEPRGKIEAIADNPPSVTIYQPVDKLYVTTRGIVLVRATVKDDLAVQEVLLSFTRTDRPAEPAQVVSLFRGGERSGAAAITRSPRGAGGESQHLEYRWDLSGLELSSGARLVFQLIARDYRPQTTTSEPRELAVITAAEYQDRLAARQSALAVELERALRLQRTCRQQVQYLVARTENAAFTRRELEQLQAAELGQRECNRLLTSRSDGLPSRLLALLDELDSNRLDVPDIRRGLTALLAELDRIEREYLGRLVWAQTTAIKTAESRLDEGRPVAVNEEVQPHLVAAVTQQDAVIAALERLLAQSAQHDSFRQFHRELSQLLREQEELGRHSVEVGRRTITRRLRELSPNEIAELHALSGRQTELARRLDRLLQEMKGSAGELEPREPLAAETLAEALRHAQRLAIAVEMRTCADNLQANQFGQAFAQQGRIVEGLKELLDILANPRRSELAHLARKLGELDADLARLEEEQTGIARRLRELSGQPDNPLRHQELRRLGLRQAELREEGLRLARRLEQCLARGSSRAVNSAAEHMRSASEGAAQGRGEDACRAAVAARQALGEARQLLDRERRLAQAELAQHQFAQAAEILKHLRQEQHRVLVETLEFDRLRRAQGELMRSQLSELNKLADTQRGLEEQTSKLGQGLDWAATFRLALAAAARHMDEAAALLSRQETSATVQRAEQRALARLELLLAALEEEGQANDQPGENNTNGNIPNGQDQQAPLLSMAELKLVRLLQEELHQRTRELQAATASGQPTEQQRRECAELSREQTRLAELLLRFLPPESSVEQPETPKAQP